MVWTVRPAPNDSCNSASPWIWPRLDHPQHGPGPDPRIIEAQPLLPFPELRDHPPRPRLEQDPRRTVRHRLDFRTRPPQRPPHARDEAGRVPVDVERERPKLA